MKKNISSVHPMMPAVIGCAIAFCVLALNEGGNTMNIAQWVAIAVAGFGVLGTLIVTFIQLKRDGKTIDQINATSNSINLATTITKEKAEKIPDISAAVNSIVARNDKIDALAKEMEFQKRLKDEYSNGFNRDHLMAGMSAVFEDNASLHAQLRESKKQIELDRVQIFQLNKQLEEKDQQIYKLSQQIAAKQRREQRNNKTHLEHDRD